MDLPLSIAYEGSVIPLDAFTVATNPDYGSNGLQELYHFFATGSTTDNGPPVEISFPDVVGVFENLFGQFSLLGLLNNPSIALDGIDFLFASIEDVLDSSFASDLPVVGSQLAGVADFMTSIRTGLLRDLRESLSDVDPIETLQSALWNVLGPGGLDVIVDATADSAASDFIDIRWFDADRNWIHDWEQGQFVPIAGAANQVGEGTYAASADALQIDVELEGNIFNAGADIPIDLGVEGFGLEVDGGVAITGDWSFNLGFGISLQDRGWHAL